MNGIDNNDGLFGLIVRNGLLMTVGALILIVLGVLAALRIPIQMIPDLEVRTISVRTSWPGATPQDVEKEILVEQEKYLGRIPGLERMVSTANTGKAEIELEFPFSVAMEEALAGNFAAAARHTGLTSQAIGRSIQALWASPCQHRKPSRAPGRSASRRLAKAADGSLKNITPKRENSRS